MSQPTSGADLEPLIEDWKRAVAIVAHPDDLEFGGAAAVARWTGQGKEVSYVLVSSGEAGIATMAPGEARSVREAEQRASALQVGVETVEFLAQSDGTLEYGVPLRRLLTAAIRRHRPDIVITNNMRDTSGGSLNHADHIATGKAVLDAVRDAGNRWIFSEQLNEALEPWGGVRQVWAPHSPRAAHGVDVTDSLEAGIRSLEAHREYINALNLSWFEPRKYLTAVSRRTGSRLGCAHAVEFEIFSFA